MILIELFSGSAIMGETFRSHGHKVLTIDNRPEFNRTYKRKAGAKVVSLGVQGLNNAFERGKLPEALCEDIVKYCEGYQPQRRL